MSDSPYNPALLSAQLVAVGLSIHAVEQQYEDVKNGEILEHLSHAEREAAGVAFELILTGLNVRRSQISTILDGCR